MNLIEQVKQFLFRRQRAYQHTFPKESELAQMVLADLAKFCRANESTFHADPRVSATLDGRREVFLRVQNHLKLDSKALFKLYARKDLSNE